MAVHEKKTGKYMYYYKWYILCAIMAVIVIGNYLIEKAKIIEPDCQIGIVTKEYVSEVIRDDLSKKIGEILGDTNGDGECYAAVYLYQYDAQAMSANDADAFMASAVQLAADLKNKVSIWYITDTPEILINADSELTEGRKYKESSVLMNIDADCLKDFIILERTPKGQELSVKIFG